MDQELIQTIFISLGLGLLVGLQREHSNSRIAGIRTFPIITLFGTISGLLAREFGVWILAGALLSTAVLIISINILSKAADTGQTTEIAILLMFCIGAYLTIGDKTAAVVTTGVTAVLLHFKTPLHTVVDKLGYQDIKVVMQFVLITFVILPLLPDKAYGPYAFLNPYSIWLMVVLIVGLSILGYFAYKFLGNKAGILLGGLLGGFVSSTATTVSYSRHSADAPQLVKPAVFVITTASAIAFIRMMIEIAVVAPAHVKELALPLGAVLIVMIILAVFTFSGSSHTKEVKVEQKNPAQLNSALTFGAIYGLVTLGTAVAKDYFGNSGLYVVAIVSGLTDVDAITLSTAKMVNGKDLEVASGWKVILIASLANLLFKGAIVATIGSRKLFKMVATVFAIAITTGIFVLFLWPEDPPF